MKQLGLGFLMYADDNGDYYPWAGGTGKRATDPDYLPDWCVGGTTAFDVDNAETWSMPGVGFNPEAGSIYPYVSSQPRVPYDPSNNRGYPVYRCPSAGRLGEALRVNYTANVYLDPGRPFGNTGVVGPRGVMTTAVIDPVRKVLMINEDPRTMTSTAFIADLSDGRKHDYLLHLKRSNISFLDGHLEAYTDKAANRLLSSGQDSSFNCGK